MYDTQEMCQPSIIENFRFRFNDIKSALRYQLNDNWYGYLSFKGVRNDVDQWPRGFKFLWFYVNYLNLRLMVIKKKKVNKNILWNILT